MSQSETSPSDPMITEAKTRMGRLDQAATDVVDSLGLPPSAQPFVLGTMFGGQAKSDLSERGSGDTRANTTMYDLMGMSELNGPLGHTTKTQEVSGESTPPTKASEVPLR